MATTHLKFKSQEDCDRFVHLHPILIMILCDMCQWALSQNLPFVITDNVSTAQEDLVLKRVSTTHRECRAADISVRGWNNDQMNKFKTEFENKYPKFGALKVSGGRELVLIHNNGNGLHIHVQLDRSFALEFQRGLNVQKV